MARFVRSFDEVNAALQELFSFRDKWETQSIDFHQRRIHNAAPGVADYDYVVVKQLPKFKAKPDEGNQTRKAGPGYDKITFGIGVGSSVVVGNDATPPFIWSNGRSGKPEISFITANIPPTGSDLIVDITQNGTSIFGVTKLVLPAGTTSKVVVTSTSIFTPGILFVRGDVFSCNIQQIGSGTPGQGVEMVIFCNLR